MAPKRTRKVRPPRQPREDLAQPTPWRLQHGGFGPEIREADPEGRVVVHRRAIDLLGDLEAKGTIDAAMREAGDAFRVQFRMAALDTIRGMPMLRIPAATGGITLAEQVLAARQRVAGALAALGGQDSAAGSCAWHVLGCETSIREWATRQGWGGRAVDHNQARGILVATLGVLAAHYRIQRA